MRAMTEVTVVTRKIELVWPGLVFEAFRGIDRGVGNLQQQ